MPHFGLMNPDEMKSAETAIMRAKLHVRGGMRRISQGKIEAGIAALHDAIISAMQYLFFSNQIEESLDKTDHDFDITDEIVLFNILKKSGLIDETFREEDFTYFSIIIEKALDHQLHDFNQKVYLKKYNNLMNKLGIIPYDEQELPPEDPATF
ncbi:MAG: hypothetical protein ACFE8U_05800 [Candidatus Hermodarchaeota archaeon]